MNRQGWAVFPTVRPARVRMGAMEHDMTFPHPRRAAALALALVLTSGFAGAAAAQTGDGVAPMGFAMTSEQVQRMVVDQVAQASVTQALQQLQADLELNPAQVRRWREFVDATLSPPPPSVALVAAGDGADPLARAQARLDASERAYERQKHAVKAMRALYASLSRAQIARLNQGLNAVSSPMVVTLAH
jgi:hypothetical protein